jgi:hypothetical protein
MVVVVVVDVTFNLLEQVHTWYNLYWGSFIAPANCNFSYQN